MVDTIHYLNTDLDLKCPNDLTGLVSALDSKGVRSLHVTAENDGYWYAIFETDEDFSEPEHNIAAMVSAIESLGKSLRKVWLGCTLKEFNIGYDCGSKPWAFNQGLSSQLLGRIAALGASLRFTIYPDRPEGPIKPVVDPQTAAEEKYRPIKEAVENAGFFAVRIDVMERWDQIQCCTKYEKGFGYSGRLVFVTEVAGEWFLITPHPYHYRVREPDKVAATVIAFLRQRSGKTLKGLVQISEEEFEEAIVKKE